MNNSYEKIIRVRKGKFLESNSMNNKCNECEIVRPISYKKQLRNGIVKY